MGEKKSLNIAQSTSSNTGNMLTPESNNMLTPETKAVESNSFQNWLGSNHSGTLASMGTLESGVETDPDKLTEISENITEKIVTPLSNMETQVTDGKTIVFPDENGQCILTAALQEYIQLANGYAKKLAENISNLAEEYINNEKKIDELIENTFSGFIGDELNATGVLDYYSTYTGQGSHGTTDGKNDIKVKGVVFLVDGNKVDVSFKDGLDINSAMEEIAKKYAGGDLSKVTTRYYIGGENSELGWISADDYDKITNYSDVDVEIDESSIAGELKSNFEDVNYTYSDTKKINVDIDEDSDEWAKIVKASEYYDITEGSVEGFIDAVGFMVTGYTGYVSIVESMDDNIKKMLKVGKYSETYNAFRHYEVDEDSSPSVSKDVGQYLNIAISNISSKTAEAVSGTNTENEDYNKVPTDQHNVYQRDGKIAGTAAGILATWGLGTIGKMSSTATEVATDEIENAYVAEFIQSEKVEPLAQAEKNVQTQQVETLAQAEKNVQTQQVETLAQAEKNIQTQQVEPLAQAEKNVQTQQVVQNPAYGKHEVIDDDFMKYINNKAESYNKTLQDIRI